jgi:hypothetical protein
MIEMQTNYRRLGNALWISAFTIDRKYIKIMHSQKYSERFENSITF